ncbi:AtpZ/AtpI family protein [Sphingobacterium sp. lm-10]|uniref:AtpZ/AtpI family protein n=1 Tax=Sphingobacterium sp. lm-10 TaxID=2944904 RepID=UPI00202183BF|nr:AtpZ/AtpI family protein [Sphingobacterium sp. lm-10]MCL7986333.1 AtpZ/AtpI family protein [Sphingobacterium sp. lm-10]
MSSKEKRKANKWLVFVSMPFQMGATIYLFYWVGQWLDNRYEVSGEWWMKGFTLIGVGVSLYHFIRLVNYVNRDE